MKTCARFASACAVAALLALAAKAHAADARPLRDLPTVPEGFKIELFAKEPLIRNPCAMSFDARGRMFVGHGPQYRNPLPTTPGDSVSILIDRDGDGVADTSKVFATGFNTIQGMVWHGRDLWVGHAPDLTIVRDLNGDDEADEYVLVYTDLGNVEHGVHGMHFGPDGKFYFTKGNSKGLTQPGRIAPKPIRELWGVEAPAGAPDSYPVRTFKKGEYKAAYQDPRDDWGREGGVLRSDDLGANLEIVSRGQRNAFDINFDSGFNWLGMDNDQSEGDRIFMPFQNAHFGWGHVWSAHWTGYRHLPTAPASGPVFNGSGTGVVFYDQPQLPEKFRGVWFMNDFLRQTTFVYRPRWDGALLLPEGGAWEEFAIGGDALYKPVDMRIGPDGAIYVTGWGRELGVVWKDGKVNGEQANEGRVFRISATGAARADWNGSKRAKPIAQWTFAELAADLDGALPVWRTDAQDELVRRGAAVKADLIALLGRDNLSTAAQTWALWTLGRIGPQDAEIEAALARFARGSVNARVQAVRIAAHRVREFRPTDKLPAFAVEALADREPRVRQAAAEGIGRGRQKPLVDALFGFFAVESDRVAFYSGWQALRGLATVDQLKSALTDYRGGVRRAALLALLEDKALDRVAVEPLVRDADLPTSEIAALWLAKQNGNPLIVLHPKPGDFSETVSVKFTPGVKPGEVYWTIDGSDPKPGVRQNSTVVMRETTTIKYGLFVEGRQVGPIAQGTWRKRAPRSAAPTVALAAPAKPTTLEEVLPLVAKANAANGRGVMTAAACFTCHRVGDEGRAIGPDLDFLGDRGDATHIVRSMLEPNAAITEGYSLVTVAARGNKSFAGIFQSETDRDLTLVQLDGEPVTITKADTLKRESAHTSIMPTFAGAMNPSQMADIVAYLLAQRTLGAPRTGAITVPAASAVAMTAAPAAPVASVALAWEMKPDRIVIKGSEGPVAEYVFRGTETLRPYFQNIHAPGAVQVTRVNPPVAPELTDHGPLHPGAGFGFGDVNGLDFWRNKVKLEHVRFVEEPAVRDGRLRFATENRFFDAAGAPLGTQLLRIAIWREGNAHWMLWDTELRGEGRDLVLGDQEEMGLAVRLTARLIERNGGEILNANGDRGARAAWSKVSDWCDYAAPLGDRRVGVTAFAHPGNPQRTWWHVRDYGLLSANAFGKRVLPAEADGKIVVKAGSALRLRYGTMFYNAPADAPVDPKAAYGKYLEAAR